MNEGTSDFLDRLTSRKFLVFTVATCLLCVGFVDQETWKWVAGFFLGANGIEKLGLHIGKAKP